MAGIAAVTLISGAAFADGEIIEIPIIDVASWDSEGSANNVVIDIPFAPGTVINGIGWDLFSRPKARVGRVRPRSRSPTTATFRTSS